MAQRSEPSGGERAGPVGVGLVERLLVGVMADRGAIPDRPYEACGPVLEALSARYGVHPAHGYRALVTLAADWLLPICLVDGHGNLGTPDHAPAEASSVEARLTPAGLLAAQHGRALDGVLALALGDLAFGGRRPPLPLAGIRRAVLALVADPAVDAATLRRSVGAPAFVGGAEAEGSVEDLLGGRWATFRLRAHVEVSSGRRHDLVVTGLPTGVGGRGAVEQLRAALGLSGPDPEWEADDGPWTPAVDLPITALDEAPVEEAPRILVAVDPGADLDQVRRSLREVEPLAASIELRLPAPVEVLLRSLVEDVEPADLLGRIDELVRAAERFPG